MIVFRSPLVLPAFLVGYDLSLASGGVAQAIARAEAADLPRWIVHVDHQAGGFGCIPADVAGALLRLDANGRQAKADLRVLAEGFRSIGEFSSEAQASAFGGPGSTDPLQAEVAALTDLSPTHGQAYSASDLALLASILETFVRVPPLETGIEAFVTFAPVDPRDHFEGWCCLSPVDELTFGDEERFGDGMHATLKLLGPSLGIEGPPRVFFLWENSD